MAQPNATVPEKEIPTLVTDRTNRITYRKGRFLGKGGFAKCYEFVRTDNEEMFAGKVVPKDILKSSSQREKMVQEVSIHRTLNHMHLVKFYSSFEDANFIYIILELCRRKSLMELHRRRQRLSEPEVRYYLKQIAEGCVYIHQQKVIHRDLKLGNIFLNDEMEIKLGDFGLATRLSQDDERKKTMCGTPNYIAPEILTRAGHSFEVDVWSVGCIVYTLLVGKPPFETANLKETYRKIRKCDYYLPSHLSAPAKNVIKRLLCLDPTERPSMVEVLQDNWVTQHFIPMGLPISALTTMPRFDQQENNENPSDQFGLRLLGNRQPFSPVNPAVDSAISSGGALAGNNEVVRSGTNAELELIGELYKQVLFLLDKYNRALDRAPLSSMHESEHPASAPVYWISKWVDYSDKYGLAYQLCDNSVGVLFNDYSRLLMTANNCNLQFITREGLETFHKVSSVPTHLEKKMKLMQHFKQYMEEYLIKAGEREAREADNMARLPYMSSWFRTSNSIAMCLSNGTLQVNIFNDHTKLILCPLMSAVTYIDGEKNFRTYKMQLLRENGIVVELSERLAYAKTQMEHILCGRQQ